MFRGNLQTAAYVACNQFTGVFGCATVNSFVFALVEKKVVAYSTPNKAFLNPRQSIYRMVNVE